jgi:hypothetical protein
VSAVRREAVLLGYKGPQGVIVLNPDDKTTPREWRDECAILLYRNAVAEVPGGDSASTE